ncbi:hypothetical protein KNP414_04696 [Paenibacillus mucilaginosus KNP414]|uniref:Uncharacterized protein n=1 Tax=Paenibacillus mucilaginosus (strain KNP414) TaxID=1036673 RepID=F8FFW4_PAEMK|nr:hypothetical protein KNP414_04696 [Paenibacillus mucilaginosus KNP414]
MDYNKNNPDAPERTGSIQGRIQGRIQGVSIRNPARSESS